MSLEPNAKKAKIVTDSVEKEMIDGVLSNDPSSQLESTIKFRKLLSPDGNPHTETVIQSGVVPRFIAFLDKEDSPKLQYEAALVITYIASDKPEVVIEHKAVPILVKLLSSPEDDVLEQAIWALGTVAGSSTENRDHVLSCDVLLPLLPHLNVNTKLSMLKNSTWTLVNLFCGHPPSPFNQVKEALPTVKRLLQSDDESVLSNACWTLWHMSYGSDEGTQCVIEAGFVPRLVQLFQHISAELVSPLLHIIDCIIAADKQHIQLVIDGGALPILADLLTQENEQITKMEACSMLTNITVGTKDQIQSVIDANLIPILVNLALNAEVDIKTKATWAISYATSGGSDDQVRYLVKENCIKPLCDLLVCENPIAVFSCLVGLENILMLGEEEKENTEGVNYYSQLIEDAEGIEKIENLQSHQNNYIHDKAMEIVQTFWLEEDQIQNPSPRYLMEQSCIQPLCDILESEDPKAVLSCLNGLENILKLGVAMKKRDYHQLISDAEGQEKIEKLKDHVDEQIKDKAVMILKKYWPGEEDEDEEKDESEEKDEDEEATTSEF